MKQRVANSHPTMSSQALGLFPHLGPGLREETVFPNYPETGWGWAALEPGSGGKRAEWPDQLGLGARMFLTAGGQGVWTPGSREERRTRISYPVRFRGWPRTSCIKAVPPALSWRPRVGRYKRAGLPGEREGARAAVVLTMRPALQLALLGAALMLLRE